MKVEFTPLGKSGEARPDETILDVARRAGVPIGNSCGGVGVCARCVVRILEGAENLNEVTSIERRVGERRNVADGDRFACQAVVRGTLKVTTSYW